MAGCDLTFDPTKPGDPVPVFVVQTRLANGDWGDSNHYSDAHEAFDFCDDFKTFAAPGSDSRVVRRWRQL